MRHPLPRLAALALARFAARLAWCLPMPPATRVRLAFATIDLTTRTLHARIDRALW